MSIQSSMNEQSQDENDQSGPSSAVRVKTYTLKQNKANMGLEPAPGLLENGKLNSCKIIMHLLSFPTYCTLSKYLTLFECTSYQLCFKLYECFGFILVECFEI